MSSLYINTELMLVGFSPLVSRRCLQIPITITSSMPSLSQSLFHVFLTHLWGTYCYFPHLTDRETEVYKILSDLRSHFKWWNLVIYLDLLDSRAWALNHYCDTIKEADRYLWEGDGLVPMQRILPSLCAAGYIATSLFLPSRLEMAFDKLLQSLESLRGWRYMWCVASEISWAWLAPSQVVHLIVFQKAAIALSMLRQNMDTVHFLNFICTPAFLIELIGLETGINNILLDGWKGEGRCERS